MQSRIQERCQGSFRFAGVVTVCGNASNLYDAPQPPLSSRDRCSDDPRIFWLSPHRNVARLALRLARFNHLHTPMHTSWNSHGLSCLCRQSFHER